MAAEEAISNFYKLKGKYDKKYNSAKRRIIKGGGPLSEQRKRIRRISMKCVDCRRPVGTKFSTAKRELVAVCGDSKDPCNLNIKIKLGVTEPIDQLLSNMDKDLNKSKLKIIEIKLNLLFSLVTEEEMEKEFEEVKGQYKSLIKVQNMILQDIKRSSMTQIDDVGGTRDIERKKLAVISQIRLGNLINDFKTMIREYELDKAVDTKMAKMESAIELYLTQIVPALKLIRDALYKVNTVIEDKGVFKLIQIKDPLKDRVFELEKPEVISNKK